MSQIVRAIQSLKCEWKQLIQKKIKKQKKKNQHSSSFKFDNNNQANHPNNKQLLIIQNIPQTIPNNNVFRLQANIQFSLNINQNNSLGSLFIDPHSNNYKILRMDKRKNLIIFTLDQINRPTTPSDIIYKIFSDRNEKLATAFSKFNMRNLQIQKLKHNTYEEMFKFENEIKNKPYVCYVNIYKDGIWKTFQKIYNNEMLKVLAITNEMLFHYCNETQLLPMSAYFDRQDEQMNILLKIFSGIVNQEPTIREYMNFNGEKFTAQLTVQSFFIFDDETNQLFDYRYCVTDCEKNWMNEDRINLNYMEYFNLKPILSSTDQSYCQEIQKRCGYKTIIE